MQGRFITMTAVGALLAGSVGAQEVYDLDPIVVKAGAPKVASQTPQAVTVINAEQLAISQPTTIGDTLTGIPGVTVTGSDRVLGQGFNIRGFGTDEAGGENGLILQIDGTTKYYQQYRMGTLFTDPDLYKRIEVLRGPASSTLYGSGALAGTLTLETRDASDFLMPGETFASRFKVMMGDNPAGYAASAYLAYRPIESFELLGVLINRDNRDSTDGNGDQINATAFSAPSGLLKGSYKFGESNEHRVFASFQQWETSEDDSEYEQTSSSGFFGTVDRDVLDQTSAVGYNYTSLDNSLIDFELRGGYSYTRVKQSNASAQIPSPLFQDSEYSYKTYQVRAENTAVIGTFGGAQESYLIGGLEYSHQTRFSAADGEFIAFQPGGTDTKVAAYAQAEFYYGAWTAIPGLRIERSDLKADSLNPTTGGSQSNTATSPKLAVMYNLTEDWAVFGSVAYTERLPSLDEIYDGVSGNLSLEPEESTNYEGGISYTSNGVLADTDAVVAKATFFQNNVNNLIERVSQTDQYYNVGKAKIYGIELESAYQFDRYFGQIGYSWMRGDNEVTGQPLDSIPADQLSVTLGTRLPSYDLELGWTGIFATAQDQVPDTAIGLPGDPTPGYGVNDIYARWTPDTGRFAGAELQVGVANIFDKQYQPHLSSEPGRGRAFTLTLAKTF